ncbi:uncharacterized protein LOC117715715 [Arvicanthis niloticus]|uniref:uncharacterized protein LOC117715715 n=1 Tax=Arvicanthis niloticus TaxID=61156 RepID=UPI001486F39C|nr:uncharacterized protein LOC117715715 [Arvicanthis niloticus]
MTPANCLSGCLTQIPPSSFQQAYDRSKRGLRRLSGTSASFLQRQRALTTLGQSPTYLLSLLLPQASGAVALLLYCLHCAARGTRGTRSAPVPQLHGARRLPPQQLSSSRSSSSPPRLGLSVGAAQPNSAAASWAAKARSIPWPGILTRIPTLRRGAPSRVSPPPSVQPLATVSTGFPRSLGTAPARRLSGGQGGPANEARRMRCSGPVIVSGGGGVAEQGGGARPRGCSSPGLLRAHRRRIAALHNLRQGEDLDFPGSDISAVDGKGT